MSENFFREQSYSKSWLHIKEKAHNPQIFYDILVES
jgi:hypothetical protein